MFQVQQLDDCLPTPALVIDGPTVQANIDSMAEYCRGHGLALRPHTKTHKSLKIGGLQLAAGAVGLTVAKAGEAEVFTHASSDILVAYPPVGPSRSSRIAALAVKHNITVGLDSVESAHAMSSAAKHCDATVGVLIDLDVGFHRTGLNDIDAILRLAELIGELPALRFSGLMCFPGHLTPDADSSQWNPYNDSLGKVIDRLSQFGSKPVVVSGGSTPTAKYSHRIPYLTEIRPGTYVFNDMNEVRLGVAGLDDCAARVIATVISRSVSGKFVVDAGSKMLSSDLCGPAPQSGYGYIMEYPHCKITRLSEEHGEIQLSDSDRVPTIGQRVTIIPNHICPCVNLQNSMWWMDAKGDIEEIKVDARGLTN